jgi:hypothetical protein
MPRKKVRKEKTREYLEGLLDRVGLSDLALAQAIKNGLESDVANERSKALELAGKWKGFYDADKKVGMDIEALPVGNIGAEDFMRMCNKCATCKHKYEPIKADIKAKEENEPNTQEAAD